MMLGYRTIFEVPGHRGTVETVALSQLRSWLRSKKLDADALEWGSEVVLAPNVTGFLQSLDGGDESRSVRARIVESNGGGRWTSTLTVHLPGDERRAPWVWLDIDGPDGASVGLPRLARSLLEVLSDARDDVAVLRAEPEIVTATEADSLAELLLDESRRRLVFVAGSDAQMPITRWKALLNDLLRDTVGLASAYVLDASATTALAGSLGPLHTVAPGTVRTFADHVAPGDPLDAQRHRVLTTQRILRGDTRAVARLLGTRARTVALQQPLPRAATRIDRLLERQVDELMLLDGAPRVEEPASPADRRTPTTPRTGDERRSESLHGAPPPVEDARVLDGVDGSTSEPAETETETPAHLREIVEQLVGKADPTTTDVDRVRSLIARGRSAEAQHTTLSARLTHLQDQLDSANDEITELRRQLDDEKLESATALDQSRDADRLVRHLRSLVIASDAAAAWSTPTPDADPPSSFVDLIDRLDELPHVTLTMTKCDEALALDGNDPLGTWAKKTWQALTALEDYACCKANGTWQKDVDSYLRETPAQYRSFSATRHALDESTTVKSNPKFRGARIFPIPDSIDPAGAVFMGAHFKIAQSGLISPRLHYTDATGIDGQVYVGYIGAHLPTKRTN